MGKVKIITMCGSLKFMKQMMIEAERLEFEGSCVLNVICPTKADKDVYTEEQLKILGKMHKIRIDLSDAIFVVNVGGYIGNQTKNEIEYATQKGKEIIYLESI